jgi:putative ABC transport system permease protein
MASLAPSVSWLEPRFVPLAWRNLSASRARLLRSSLGIAFAVLLILAQLGFQHAFFASSLAVLNDLRGDLFIFNAAKYRVETRDPFAPQLLAVARGVQGIESVRPFYADWVDARWQSPKDGRSYLVQVLAFDPDRPAITVPGLDAPLQALNGKDAIFVDRGARRFLGMDQGARESELNGTKVRIAGTFDLGPDFQNDGTVIMSSRSFAHLLPGTGGEPPGVEIGVVDVDPGTSLAAARAALRRALPASVTVMTKRQMIDYERHFLAEESSAGPIFLIGTIVGFVVGVLISYQIVYTDIAEQLPQYATLKAIGYRTRYLLRVVFSQASLMALLGFVPAWLAAFAVYRVIAELAVLPTLHMTLGLSLKGLALSFGMALVAAAVAVHRVVKADPAEVF